MMNYRQQLINEDRYQFNTVYKYILNALRNVHRINKEVTRPSSYQKNLSRVPREGIEARWRDRQTSMKYGKCINKQTGHNTKWPLD